MFLNKPIPIGKRGLKLYMNKYLPIIGLEVHVELNTKSKMFCGCSADYFGKSPNTLTCPVCLGLPGALPVPNKRAIEYCMMIAHALNCEINTFSKFDRKNYFYPDLPKGFQISQYDLPFGANGHITLKNGKKIGIRRVHMEEDTAKLTHGYLETKNTNLGSTHKAKVSFIDYNRSGVPLVEIVTEPDFTDAKEVVEYLQKLRQVVRYLEVSNADMEKGEMRLEPNISLKKIDQDALPSYKVEVKNINSFRFVEKAINYEISRQREILEEGNTPQQETRGWDEDKGLTFSQRVKEEANDYRYFPEPDIPPIRYSLDQISNIKLKVPELQEEKISRFIKQFAIPYYDAEILTREKALADYFEEAVKIGHPKGITPKQIGNAIINKKIDYLKTSPERLITEIEKSTKIESVSDEQLQSIIEKVLMENPKAVQDYKSGKESVIMFLVGMTMRAIKRKIDAQIVRKKLEERLKN